MEVIYRSTRSNGAPVTASQAILKGLSDDGGLFVPDHIPTLDKSLKELAGMTYQQVAYEVMKLFLTDFTEEELKNCLDLAYYVLTTLGLQDDVTYRLSKWDPNNKEKYLGDDEYWETTQDAIRNILVDQGVPFVEAEGEAAFYGPKIDIQAKNVYGKEDTMITIQLDCAIAENFDMYYIDQNGEKQRPYVIHRTSMGCYERTLAWLIEKYAGKFPTWLCPEQVRVLPISEKFADYAEEVNKELKRNGILSTVDNRSEKIGYKIREARLQKLPYMLVVGAQEQETGKVSVRSRFAGDEGQKDLKDFISAICEEIRTKEIRQEVEE